jgi:hypothetical protein
MELQANVFQSLVDPVTAIAIVAVVLLGISMWRDRRERRRRRADPRVITLSGQSRLPRRNRRFVGMEKTEGDASAR